MGSHSLNRMQWLCIVTDFSCIASGAILSATLRFSVSRHPATESPALADNLCVTALYSVLIVLWCQTQGLYSAYRHLSRYGEFVAVFKSIFLATFLLVGTLFVCGIKSTSRIIIACTAIYALATMLSWRSFRRRSLGKAIADGLSCHNVLIIGTDPPALTLAHHLTTHKQLGFVVLGHLGSPLLEVPSEAFKLLGCAADLKTICRQHFADEVIICTNHRPTVLRAISDARECGLGIRVIPDLYDGAALGAQLHYLGDFPTLVVARRSVPAIAMRLKRMLDIVVSGAALTCLCPLLFVLALIVKLDSEGPVFYSSRRVGKKGRPFFCHKFRTMVVNADQLKTCLSHLNERDGILFKIADDPRITRSGRIMRKYSLDELPQLWNVLNGDMSLVGPRPPLMGEVKEYHLDYLRRLEAAPGITGLWQVEARNHPSFDRYISLDLQYIENWSLALDLHILLRTVAVVFAGTGS